MPYSVSNEFKEKVNESHQIVTKVELMYNGAVVQELTSVDQATVSEDKANEVRSRLSMVIVDETGDLTPASLNDRLAPKSANEIKLYRGLKLDSGADELVPLGVYNYKDVNIEYPGPYLTLGIEGFDRSEIIRQARFTDVYIVDAGSPIENAIRTIIQQRMPWPIDYIFGVTGFTTQRTVFDRGSDPWEACTVLAESAGYEIFFDRNGNCVLQPEPNLRTAAPNWIFDEDELSTVLSMNKKFSSPEYNHTIEIGEGSNIPVPFFAEAKDNDPYSPTYVGLGDRPVFHVSEFYTSVAQAQAAADAKLIKVLGSSEDISFQCLANPAMMVGDLILVRYAQPKIDAVYIIDKLSTSLRVSISQYASTRKRTINA